MKRPIGLTILSIGHFIVGIFLYLSVLGLILLSFLYETFPELFQVDSQQLIPRGAVLYLNSMVLLAIGSLAIFTGYGILKGWSWIWYIEILISTSLLLNILFLSIDSLYFIVFTVMPVAIIYYLYRPRIKGYFFPSTEKSEYVGTDNSL